MVFRTPSLFIINCPILYFEDVAAVSISIKIINFVFSQSSPDTCVSLTKSLTGVSNNVLAVIPTVSPV